MMRWWSRRRLSRTVLSNLMPATDWYAVVEGVAGKGIPGYRPAPVLEQGELSYAPVIAFERYGSDDEPQIRAWLAGTTPIASDHLHEVCDTHFINYFCQGKPPGAQVFIWA